MGIFWCCGRKWGRGWQNGIWMPVVCNIDIGVGDLARATWMVMYILKWHSGGTTMSTLLLWLLEKSDFLCGFWFIFLIVGNRRHNLSSDGWWHLGLLGSCTGCHGICSDRLVQKAQLLRRILFFHLYPLNRLPSAEMSESHKFSKNTNTKAWIYWIWKSLPLYYPASVYTPEQKIWVTP